MDFHYPIITVTRDELRELIRKNGFSQLWKPLKRLTAGRGLIYNKIEGHDYIGPNFRSWLDENGDLKLQNYMVQNGAM